MRRRTPSWLRALVLAGASLGCAACQETYLARRDTLTLGTGEAVQANAAMHVIDPWPPHAMRVDPDTDGARAQRAIERYRNPVSGPGIGILPPIPVGASGVPSTPVPLSR